jgi:AraC family transcriptional regulator of adaptative response/methylated-DNA-[protein]-cysteine methyltransferase
MDLITELCRYLQENCGDALPLEALGQRSGLSPYTVLRKFKAKTGLTPRQFQAQCRLSRLKASLAGGGTVTEAVYEAGYGSPSRVYENSLARLGMTPGQYKAAGKDLRISCIHFPTEIGEVLIAATDQGICSLQLGESGQQLLELLQAGYSGAVLEVVVEPYAPQLEAWRQAILAYLRGRPIIEEMPLDIRATAFQARVWKFLQAIPAGETRTYQQVAEGIGSPTSTRAVARACAANPVALVIPCHRVIRAGGALAGYRWGLERKRQLLEIEQRTR